MRPLLLSILCAASACASPANDGGLIPAPNLVTTTTTTASAAPTPTVVPAAPPAWTPPPPPDALLSELAGASPERLGQIIETLASDHGGAALVAALERLPAQPPEKRWFWQMRTFDAIDRAADPRAAEPLAALASRLGPLETPGKNNGPKASLDADRSQRAYARTRVGFALAELGDLRAVPLLVERLGLDPLVAHDPVRFWEADASGHLSKSDTLRVVAARMLSEVFDANPSAPASAWADAERATLAWAKDRPLPHANAMRFLARVRSASSLAALRTWAFPKDPLPKEGAQGPFPTSFMIAQSALSVLGLADPASGPKLVAELGRKPADFDGSQQGLMSAPVAMRGMALRAIGVGASAGLGGARDPATTDALWLAALDPKMHEDVRISACDALGAIADPASLKVLLSEATVRSQSLQPDAQLVSGCALRALALAGHPQLAPDLVAVLEQGASSPLVQAVARALATTDLAEVEQRRIAALLARPTTLPDALPVALWSTQHDVAALRDRHDKLPTAEQASVDQQLLAISDRVGTGSRAPQLLARWAARARQYKLIAKRPQAEEGLRVGLSNVGLAGPGWTRPGLRRALLAMARAGDAGALLALALGSERGPLLALASGAGGTPIEIVTAARAELARSAP